MEITTSLPPPYKIESVVDVNVSSDNVVDTTFRNGEHFRRNYEYNDVVQTTLQIFSNALHVNNDL